jgi:hypothetical protein
MSNTSDINEVVKNLPENFYDILAYLVPGTILLLFPVFIFNQYDCFLSNAYKVMPSIFEKICLSLIALMIVYIFGQFITTFSWIVIYILLDFISSKHECKKWVSNRLGLEIRPSEKIFFSNTWVEDFIRIRAKQPAIGLELTKRYARLNLSRNNTFVALILIVLSFFSFQKVPFTVLIIFFFLSLADTYIRRFVFLDYIQKISKNLK